PLPNLDYKIVCGNSLLGVEKDLFNAQAFAQLERLKPLLFNETDATKKQEYKQQIEQIIKQITHNDEHFDFEVYFSEVFHEKKGFDVIIANPPYVRVDEIDPSYRDIYKSIFKTTVGKYDLYYLFFEKACSVNNNNSTIVFISPNKYCASDSGYRLRDLIFSNIKSFAMMSTSRLKVFDSVSNYPVISILKKYDNIDSKTFYFNQAKDIDLLGRLTNVNSYIAKIDDLRGLPNFIIPINISQNEFDLAKKLYKDSKFLSQFISISEGLRIPEKLESETRQDFAIVKQYQFSKYSSINFGTYISKNNLAKVISKNSDRYKKFMHDKILIAEDALEICATIDDKKWCPRGEFILQYQLAIISI
ncbi:MAG: Eco57I restriction-modification methylase domain-containing protein, partial [bacterium]|nr:Eco57I restriction-modification methylase domain-containing protein [bacterium]